MAIGAFARLTQGVLAVYGEDALLRESEPCRVAIEHGVEIVGEYGEMTLSRSVATIETGMQPKIGDPLTVGAKSYVLDALLQNNGYSLRFVLRDPYTPPGP